MGYRLHKAVAECLRSDTGGKSILRIGNTESSILGEYVELAYGYRERYSEHWIQWLISTSGFFVSDNKNDAFMELNDFAQMQIDAMAGCDILMAWTSCYLDFLKNHFTSQKTKLVKYEDMLPFDEEYDPWTRALAGKKVLVVTSFAESVERQYSHKDGIVRNKRNELPEFELKTYQMINTMMGTKHGFKKWKEAYNYVLNQIMEIDFEIAIIGAGAYAVPLCADLKKSGKKAIAMCGYTPTMFGIAGNKDFRRDTVKKYGTDAWIRPIETPPDFYMDVEGGAYW